MQASSQFNGWTGVPFSRTSKCRWAPVDAPVLPLNRAVSGAGPTGGICSFHGRSEDGNVRVATHSWDEETDRVPLRVSGL